MWKGQILLSLLPLLREGRHCSHFSPGSATHLPDKAPAVHIRGAE